MLHILSILKERGAGAWSVYEVYQEDRPSRIEERVVVEDVVVCVCFKWSVNVRYGCECDETQEPAIR